ncbi:xanthine dehydrogenase family protein molybdopterin-binding subunit [Acuticoccus mangrovi]|uniref:Xanthine dehydrogenase family protein n=1 Tax=Acuticoccus mangrovi TaxID=2796142 RepID=A0A934IQR2_9HYPH|nr:xanthine dehydrogenase family protein molybdopterin-binding subunit [Acuticoccus mangrovi]MBJ3776888.1 xanthine dehydrogenase family protein [Acuticoccus mangrovi]
MNDFGALKFGIGARATRLEDQRFVTGAGRYGDDIRLPGETFAEFVMSPAPAGRIRAIDTEAAKAMPGVLGVFTMADLDTDGVGDIPALTMGVAPLFRPDGTRATTPPRPPLAREEVRFVGDTVAMVVAESRAAARDAVEAVTVEIDEAPFVLDLMEAEGGPAVWPHLPDNLAYLWREGDAAAVDAAIEAADHVATVTVPFARLAMVPMEPRSAVAVYEDERYVLHCGTQNPHIVRQMLAENVFKVPLEAVRVTTPDMGGGFGMRSTVFPEMVAVTWAAKRLGRPVKWTGRRSDAFLADDMGRDVTMTAELALAADGTFQALRVKSVATLGAYVSMFGPVPTFANLGGLASVYRTPAISAEVRTVYTHTTPIAPYRGAGRPEAIAVMELAIDGAAREFGFDRMALRRKNMIRPDEMPFQTGLSYNYDSGDFPAVMARAEALADVAGFPARKAAAAAEGRLLGLGVVMAIEASAGLLDEEVEVAIDADGHATIRAGSINHGQGHETTLRQIVADRLPIAADAMTFSQGDTNVIPYGNGTFGSRTAVLAGSATLGAVDGVVARAKEIAAHLMSAEADAVDFDGERFTLRESNQIRTFAEVAAAAHDPAQLPPGAAPGLAATVRFGSPDGPTFPNGCHVCEISIDTGTAMLTVERYVAVCDIGTVINPTIVEGQIHGGVVQGLGEVIGEVMIYDDATGGPVTGSFMDYAMPRAEDVPEIVVELAPSPTPKNPLGAKGCGEAGTVGGLTAGLAAVADALADLGITAITMPATPGTLWRILDEAKAACP